MRKVPSLPSLWHYLAYWARETPDAEALVEGQTRLTYAQLARRVNAIAGAMADAGIGPGDRVATLAGPTIPFVETFLAANALGAIWLGLNPKYRARELLQVLQDAAPALIFFGRGDATGKHGRELAEVVSRAGLDSQLVALTVTDVAPLLDDWMASHAAPDLRAATEPAGHRAAVLVYTSGSTGVPKGAMLSNAAITSFASKQNDLWPLTPHRALNYFPINHIGSLIDLYAPCHVAGGTMVLMEQFDPLEALLLVERERLTLWGSVPSVFMMQLALPELNSVDLSSLQLIVWEGAAMPIDVVQSLREICPRMATNYGMTETTSAITALQPTNDVALLTETVGRPLPGIAIRLCDEHGNAVPPGVPGEVHTYSDQLTLGYWGNPQATAAAFSGDGWFRTGDLAIERDDGNFSIVGRVSEMYKSGGYNVYPREVELVIETLQSVVCAAVVSVEDRLWQEVGVAFVAAPNCQIDEADLERHCRALLANYKVPKHFLVLESLPLLPIGKVDKVKLKAQAKTLFASTAVEGNHD